MLAGHSLLLRRRSRRWREREGAKERRTRKGTGRRNTTKYNSSCPANLRRSVEYPVIIHFVLHSLSRFRSFAFSRSLIGQQSSRKEAVMGIIVQKYGGSSVADVGRIREVAEKIAARRAEGHELVVVVSAMG